MDYLVAGPVFKTGSHSSPTPAGLSLLVDVVAIAPVPVIAIGGMGPGRVGRAVYAGASGIAAISSILGSSDPKGRACMLRERLDSELATRNASS
jgi:thiamine monophosphate synthase